MNYRENISNMLIKLSRTIAARNFVKSPNILVRNSHNSSAVALASNEYKNQESEGNPLIILHGLFGSKSNW